MSELSDNMVIYIGTLAARCTKNNLIFRCRREDNKVQSILMIEAIDNSSGLSAKKEVQTLELMYSQNPKAQAELDGNFLLKKLNIVEKKPRRLKGKV